jgi:glutathione S-transferase
VGWAFEGAGLQYQERLSGREDLTTAAYRALQPFGQVPAIEEDGFKLFESGGIVLHIAGRSEALMPADAMGRARTTAWMFAAVNTVEPPIRDLAGLDFFYAGGTWTAAALPAWVDPLSTRPRRCRRAARGWPGRARPGPKNGM